MGFIIVLVLIFLGVMLASSPGDKNTKRNEQKANVPPRENKNTASSTPVKRIPPLGRALNWNNNKDIYFTVGSFVAGFHAGGFIMVAENGTIRFCVGTCTDKYIDEILPSDIAAFLSVNPTILRRTQHSNDIVTLRLEFDTSFNIKTPRTRENVQASVDATMDELVVAFRDGIEQTKALLGIDTALKLKIEGTNVACHKTLQIDW